MIETRIDKCAVVMMTLGEEAAAEVLKHMSATEVQQVSAAMASLRQITRQDVLETLGEFQEEASQFMAVDLGSGDYIKEVLIKALGSDRAAGIIEDIMDTGIGHSGIDALNSLEPSSIAELINSEHPQIIATILVHLDRDRAAGVLGLLSERLRNDVLVRIATFGGVQPSALHDLTESFTTVLSGQGARRSRLGGVRTAAEILNAMKGQDEEAVLAELREFDRDLAQRVEDEMFIFDNLIELDSAGIQMLLREVKDANWAIAFKGADQALVQFILINMSTRAAEMMRDDIDSLGPVRLSVVEAERKKILAVARRMADAGQITLGKKGEDEYV